MSGPTVMGTFVRAGEISSPIQSFSEAGAFQPGFTLDIIGLDANNTAKLQKSSDNGLSWVDVTTYSANQNKTIITEATTRNAQHRLICLAKQALSVTGVPIQFKMARELPTNRSTPPG